jgi:glycosyltransferase involved in cell wall biosynthesis
LSSLLLLNFRKGVPLIYTMHDPTPYMCSYPSWQEHAIRQASFKCVDLSLWHRADHIVVVSNALKKELVRWGVSPQKISVIFSGVDTEFLKRNDDCVSPRVKAKYGIKGRYCLFVGRLTLRKGINYLLRALVETNITCVIVGEGPQRDDLILLANRLGIKGKVIFTGYVPKSDLKEVYAGASFFVFPSLADVGVTLTILEALSTGLPVIATDIPGTGEIVRDGYNGFLIPPRRDVEALRSKIQLLVDNTELCKKMGMEARRTVGRKFSWHSVAEKTITVYESLCNRRNQ